MPTQHPPKSKLAFDSSRERAEKCKREAVKGAIDRKKRTGTQRENLQHLGPHRWDPATQKSLQVTEAPAGAQSRVRPRSAVSQRGGSQRGGSTGALARPSSAMYSRERKALAANIRSARPDIITVSKESRQQVATAQGGTGMQKTLATRKQLVETLEQLKRMHGRSDTHQEAYQIRKVQIGQRHQPYCYDVMTFEKVGRLIKDLQRSLKAVDRNLEEGGHILPLTLKNDTTESVWTGSMITFSTGFEHPGRTFYEAKRPAHSPWCPATKCPIVIPKMHNPNNAMVQYPIRSSV